MPVTNVDVANSALMKIGARSIVALSDTTAEGLACNARIEFCKRAVLRSHPWNFAIKRASLVLKTISGAADNGSGLIRITATTHGFATGNYVTVAGVKGTQEANGQWTITVIDANTFDLQGSTFTNAYVSGGSVGLAPAFGYSFSHALPSDCLRIVFVDSSEDRYRIEGRRLLSDEESIDMKYVADHTDYDTMDPLFHEALAYYLAWDISYRISQNASVKQLMLEGFQATMSRARFVNAVEEPAEVVQADDWTDARIFGSRQYVRDPMT